MRAPSLAGWLVVSSLVLLVYGVVAGAFLGAPVVHVLVVSGAVLVFYAAVAAAYLSSASRGDRLVYALGVLHALLYVLVVFGLVGAGLVAGGVAGLAACLAGLARGRGAGRLAAASLAPVYALSVAVGYVLLGGGVGWLGEGLWALYAVPGAAVAPVNTFALIKTYGVGAGWLPLLLSLSYAVLLVCCAWRGAGFFILAYGVLVAVLTLLALRSRVYRGAGGVARKSHQYMLVGEAFVAAFSVLHGVLVLAGAGLLVEAHTLAMGYIAGHVFIHAPLMLPPILRAPAARRYTPLPYLLLAASLAARLVGLGHLSLTLFLASLASLAYTAIRVGEWLGGGG